jgi:hypothetical protein
MLVATSTVSYGQSPVKFPSDPRMFESNDSLFYEVRHQHFYSFFKQSIDSIFVSFDNDCFDQVVAMSKTGRNGYYKVSYKGQVLVWHEIIDGEISGLGLLWHPNLFGKKHVVPYCQSIFLKSKLNGNTVFMNDRGKIIEILKYKKGKYKKHIYHHLASTHKVLRKGNRRTRDPFAPS